MILDSGGLYLELRPGGSMSWRYRFTLNKRPGKINLGRYPLVSLAEARQRRTELAKGIAAGISPTQQRQAQQTATERGQTVKEFSERYLREVVNRARQNPNAVKRYFERDIWPVIGKKPLLSVTKHEIRALIFKRIEDGHEQAALAIRNILKRLWDYAVDCEITEINPAGAIKAKYVAAVVSRSRALNPAEIGAFLRALDAARMRPDLKAALRLILLNLTRKGELRLARWDEFNLEAGEWAIPEEHSKTGAQIVYLSRQAVAILKEQRQRHPHASVVFPMRGSQHAPLGASTLNRALERLPLRLNHFTVHDLRRTSATNLSEQEYADNVIEKALNHKIKGVRGVYNRAQYAKQRREMLQAWADCLDRLQTGADIGAQSKVEK